jgi:hypothetical protein
MDDVWQRRTILAEKMQGVSGYDYISVDCSPSVNLLNENAVFYAHEVFAGIHGIPGSAGHQTSGSYTQNHQPDSGP